MREESGLNLNLRIGMASGPVTAGVIGTRKFSYDVWGDPVNLASRLEGQSSPGRILICPGCRAKLGEDFVFEARGPIEIKGIGAQEAWFLLGERDADVRHATAATRRLHRRTALEPETLLDALEQLIAHLAVVRQRLLARPMPDHDRCIDGRPVFDVDGHGARQLQRLMVRLGRQRDDEIERGIVQIAQRVRRVLRDVDADLVHDRGDERIERAGPHAGRGDIGALAGQVAQDRRRHDGAHGIGRAGEEHRSGKLAGAGVAPAAGRAEVCAVEPLATSRDMAATPSSAARRSA